MPHTATVIEPYADASASPAFDVPGLIRRLRRTLDLSQADLAKSLGVSQSTVARWETGSCEPSIRLFTHMMAMAGWVLAVHDVDDAQVRPMRPDGVRDAAGRRRPAHLDVHMESPLQHCAGRKATERRAAGRVPRDSTRRHTGVIPDDHPTEEDVRAYVAKWRQDRKEENQRFAERLRQAMIARGEPDPHTWECQCLDECFDVPGCLMDCPCQCEPVVYEPGGAEPVSWTDREAERTFVGF